MLFRPLLGLTPLRRIEVSGKLRGNLEALGVIGTLLINNVVVGSDAELLLGMLLQQTLEVLLTHT